MKPGRIRGGGMPAAHLGEQVSALIDGQVGHDQRERLLAHLAHCSVCRADAEAERRTRETLNLLAEPSPPPDLMAALLSIPSLPTAEAGGLAGSGRRVDGADLRGLLSAGPFALPRTTQTSFLLAPVGAMTPVRGHSEVGHSRVHVRLAAAGAVAAVVGSLGVAAVSAGSLTGSPPPIERFGLSPTSSPGGSAIETASLTSDGVTRR